MGKIVYSHTERNRPDNFDGYGISRVPTDRKLTVFAERGKVAMVHSVLMSGRASRTSDKRYWYWVTDNSVGFYTNRFGTVQPYHAFRGLDGKKTWSNCSAAMAFEALEEDVSMSIAGFAPGDKGKTVEAYRNACAQYLGITNIHDLYPIAELYNISEYAFIPYSIKGAMKLKTWDEFTTALFGKTRVNKRWVSAVEKSEPFMVSIAHQMRGVASDDVVLKFLENNHIPDDLGPTTATYLKNNPNVRPYALTLDNAAADRVMNSEFDTPSLVHVARLQYNKRWGNIAATPKNINNWSDLRY